MANKLKIGIDFHGVITVNPTFFSALSREAIRRGYEVHIISGGPAEVVRRLLDEWQVSYTTVFAIIDFYEVLHAVTYAENGEALVEDKLWNTAKAAYCKENGIDLHIDDSQIYQTWFSTPFCLYDAQENSCHLDSGQKIDFSVDANLALDEIEKILANQ